METFLALNEWLLGFSVAIAAVSNYLIINKLWTRRLKKDVAESILISAALLGLATGFPFFVEFALVTQNWAAASKVAIGILTGIVFILVGSGLWVTENRGEGFLKLFARALSLERKESGDLVKSLAQPTGAKELIKVFEAMASVDKHIDAREIKMIEEFAARWRVEPPSLKEGELEVPGDVVMLRFSVEDYLAIKPPVEQAEELLDVLHLFFQADVKVSPEEEVVLEELTGMITQYVTGEVGEHEMFEVVIVPQGDDQLYAVESILPGVVAKEARGGMVFSAGRFFSTRYAEAVCDKYIALGLFTARVDA